MRLGVRKRAKIPKNRPRKADVLITCSVASNNCGMIWPIIICRNRFRVRALYRVGGCYLDEMRVDNDRGPGNGREGKPRSVEKYSITLLPLLRMSRRRQILESPCSMKDLPRTRWPPRFTVLIVVQLWTNRQHITGLPSTPTLYVESFTRMDESSPALLINYSDFQRKQWMWTYSSGMGIGSTLAISMRCGRWLCDHWWVTRIPRLYTWSTCVVIQCSNVSAIYDVRFPPQTGLIHFLTRRE